MHDRVSVITIDGPSGSGKGTIASLLAKRLGWHFLDSGALYRAVAWGIIHYQIPLENHAALADLLPKLKIEMVVNQETGVSNIYCDGIDVTEQIRSPTCSQVASQSSSIPMVRAALLEKQREMRKAPGLVTDGRDMGTVVFPDADLKFFFQATPQERALRRYNQLKAKGKDVTLRDIERELCLRDRRDEGRSISPSKPAPDAVMIDTTGLSIESVFQAVYQYASPFL